MRAIVSGAGAATLVHAPGAVLPFWQDDYVVMWAARHHTLAEILFPPSQAIYWRPFSTGLWWWVMDGIFGADALPYHIANLLLVFAVGCLAGVLAWRFATRISPTATGDDTRLAGFASGFLFTGHGAFLLPVAWACGSQELFAILFILLAVLAWDAAMRRTKPAPPFAPMCLAALAAHASKEGTVALPALLAIMGVGLGAPRRRALTAALLTAAVAGCWLLLRAQHVDPPLQGSPYELTFGINIARNAVALAVFSANVPREAIHLVSEGHPLGGGSWALLAGSLWVAGAALVARAWHSVLGSRGWLLLAAWFGCAIGPYLLLRWNCYPYYAVLALAPIALLGALIRGRCGRAALACMAASSLVTIWGQWLAPYPATFARARAAEAAIDQIVRAPLPAKGPIHIIHEGATKEFHAVGWEHGLSLRTGIERSRFVRHTAGADAPPEGPRITFLPGGGVRVEPDRAPARDR